MQVAVVGGGPTGALAALMLAKRNYKVHVYEARRSGGGKNSLLLHDEKKCAKEENPSKRSINLALSHRGLQALKKVGLDQQAKLMAVPMRGRMIHNKDGTQQLQPYGTSPDEVLYSVSRSHINQWLMDHLGRLTVPSEDADEKSVSIHYGHKLVKMDRDFGTGGVRATFSVDDASEKVVHTTHLLGCDGAYSATRSSLSRLVRLSNSIEYISHVYKEFEIPASSDGRFAMFAEALHIWPANDAMLIALPNCDGSFTATLFGDCDQLDLLDSEDKVIEFFSTRWPDTIALMPRLAEDYAANPTGALMTVKCDPWFLKGEVLLMGDAAHAVVPFYGQGMNCALEDVDKFVEALDTHGDDWASALPAYAASRKKATDALAELALNNYAEMRDKTIDRIFLFKSALHRLLHGILGPSWAPSLHTVVSFTSVPYNEARDSFSRQDTIMTALLCACGVFAGIRVLRFSALIQDRY